MDDCASFIAGDRLSVDIADLVRDLCTPAGRDAGEQCGGDVAQRGVVMLAAFDHEAVIFGRQCGIEAAGLIGADEQGFA